MEEGDQFYFIVYEIVYADPEARPEDNAAETMVIRLALTSGESYRLVVPTPYVFRGYARGISGMYFGPASTPPWDSSEVFAEVIGNPVLDWNGGQPVSNRQAPTHHSSDGADDEDLEGQKIAIANAIGAQIPVLELNWFTITDTITDLIAGEPAVLTASGEEYFLQASPHQRSITPTLYSFNISNPDLVSIGKSRLTQPATSSDVSISVSDIAEAEFKVSQEIMLIGASVNERVTIEAVADKSLNISPPLTYSYPAGSEVWVVSQSTQTRIEGMVEGSMFDRIRMTGAAALGLSPVMFGVLASLTLSGGAGVVAGVALAGQTNYGFFVGVIVAVLVLVLLTFLNFMPSLGLASSWTIVLILAFWIHFFR